ncbi:hypothetical protein BKA83DRAFT_4130942 [Pisolithus microcarpus]|nr:hypothetical protein BKA83DRAFT_4130942 [Pisolithus microcarpus]
MCEYQRRIALKENELLGPTWSKLNSDKVLHNVKALLEYDSHVPAAGLFQRYERGCMLKERINIHTSASKKLEDEDRVTWANSEPVYQVHRLMIHPYAKGSVASSPSTGCHSLDLRLKRNSILDIIASTIPLELGRLSLYRNRYSFMLRSYKKRCPSGTWYSTQFLSVSFLYTVSRFWPTTQFTSRTGMRHYSPYNLRSRGSRQAFECLPTPSGSPTHPRSSATDGDAGGLRTPAGESMYDAARQALLAGVPVDTLCHLVLLQFVRDCADMAEAVYDEQQRVLVALENGMSISDNESRLFCPVQMQHVRELMEIADGVTNNLEGRLARNCAETTQAMFGEQRRIILAYTAGQSVSEDELKIFHPIEVEYIGTLVKIANTINDDLEHNILGYGQLVELIIGLAL